MRTEDQSQNPRNWALRMGRGRAARGQLWERPLEGWENHEGESTQKTQRGANKGKIMLMAKKGLRSQVEGWGRERECGQSVENSSRTGPCKGGERREVSGGDHRIEGRVSLIKTGGPEPA